MFKFVSALALSVGMSMAASADDMFQRVQATASDDGGPATYEFRGLAPSVMRMQAGDTIDMNFGSGYEVVLDRITTQALGTQTWVGRIAGETLHSRVIISENNGIVFGRMMTDDGLWYIIPSANGGHEIMQIPEGTPRFYRENDTVRYDMNQFVNPPSPNPSEPSTAEMVPVGSNGNIDVAVFYSQSFVAQWGMTSSARVQHLVAVLDTALVDSDTGLRARLVFNGPVTLTNDNVDQAQTLANLSGIADPNEAPTITQDLSALRAVRQSHGADLVGIIQIANNGHGGCGIANLLGSPSTDGDINANWANRGYSVTGDWFGGGGFCSDITYAHEVGHNLGMAHNVEDSGIGTGVRTYANGHREDCDFITIMSYPTQGGNCPPGAPRTIGNEMEAPHFSNPSINLCPGNAPCGIAVPAGGDVDGILTNDPADNARAAREESKDVALFQAEVPRIVSSVLPLARSVQNGTTATAFATVINPNSSGSTATGCGLRLGGATPAQFSYQLTDPGTNTAVGTLNPIVQMQAGHARSYVFSVTSAADFDDNTGLAQNSANDERNLFIEAFCDNRRSSEFTLGLNTLTFTSSAAAPPDIIALSATVGNSGEVNVPQTGNMVGVFSVAVINIGATGTVRITADTGTVTQPLQNIEICRTDPNTGACTTPRAAFQDVTLNQNDTATFGVFVRGNGQQILFSPATNRVFVRVNEGNSPRGATSVGLRTGNVTF
jgi:Metallo-peptidase family M12B Reprolysin-like